MNLEQARAAGVAEPLRQETPCAECGWANFLIRKRCRNCGADLVQHPDPVIDAEVRNDYADGLESERQARLANAINNVLEALRGKKDQQP